MRSLRHSAALAAACALIFSASAVADSVPAGSKALTAGNVTATLSWSSGEQVGVEPRLQIARDGTTVLDSDLAKECELCGSIGEPTGSALHLADLDGDGEPEVLVDLYTGGAHCCATTLIWYLKDPATNLYARRVLSLGDQAYRLDDLDGDGSPEIIAASLDRHLYAWHADGTPVHGFPVLVEDPAMVAKVDPETDNITLKSGVTAYNQGKLVDTPAVGDVNGDGKPDIVVGSNEEYRASEDGGFNASNFNTTSASIISLSGDAFLHPANGRVYAIKSTGNSDGHPFLPGWPVKVALLDAELLPDVGEGINGSPVLAPLTCPSGGQGTKVGVTPAAGIGYILNGDGTSCYGAPDGKAVGLATDASAGAGQTDHPIFPAVGLPAFGDLGRNQPSFVAPAAGLLRAVDLIAPDYQVGSQDFTSAWNTATGQVEPGWPAQQNDLSFLTGPVIADIDGLPGQEVVAGTSSLDLQAFNAAGVPASTAWPKLTGDWMVATPEIGSFGTLDTDSSAHKTVVGLTRLGSVFAFNTAAPACSPASWPRFHHDNANSGDYTRDAVLPGRPMDEKLAAGKLTFLAPGDDLLCGTADHYEISVDGGAFTKLAGVTPVAPGATQTVDVPADAKHSLAIRAVDDQGNVGRDVEVKLK